MEMCAEQQVAYRRQGSCRKRQLQNVMAGFKYAPESPATYMPSITPRPQLESVSQLS